MTVLMITAVPVSILDRVLASALLAKLVSDAPWKVYVLNCKDPHVQIVVYSLSTTGKGISIG